MNQIYPICIIYMHP